MEIYLIIMFAPGILISIRHLYVHFKLVDKHRFDIRKIKESEEYSKLRKKYTVYYTIYFIYWFILIFMYKYFV